MIIFLKSFSILLIFVLSLYVISANAQLINYFKISPNGNIVDSYKINNKLFKSIINETNVLNFTKFNVNVNVTTKENTKENDIKEINALRKNNPEIEFIETPNLINKTKVFQNFFHLNERNIQVSPSFINNNSIRTPILSSMSNLDLLFTPKFYQNKIANNYQTNVLLKTTSNFYKNWTDGIPPDQNTNNKNDDSKLLKFDGINASSCIDCVPPDVQIAVGKNHVIEVINEFIGIFDKSGKLINNTTLRDFFDFNDFNKVPLHNVISTDPNVYYDFNDNRWIFSVLIFDGEKPTPANRFVLLAISNNDNPTNSWSYGLLPIRGNNNECTDRPMLGISNSHILISVNLFHMNSEGFCIGGIPNKVEIALVNKTDLLKNKISVNTTVTKQFPYTISLMPIKTYGIDPAICLASAGFSQSPYLLLKAIEIKNGIIVESDRTIELQNITQPPRIAFQPPISINKQSNPLHMGDARILDGSYQNGKLWIVFNTSCQIDGDHPHTCLRVILLDNGDKFSKFHCSINNFKKVDEKSIARKDTNYFYPSIQVDKNNNAIVLTGLSSANKEIHPSLNILNLSSTNNEIKSNQEINLIKGTSIANDSLKVDCLYYDTKMSCIRMGDYSSIILDPKDYSIWSGGEYYKSKNFSTIIAKIIK